MQLTPTAAVEVSPEADEILGPAGRDQGRCLLHGRSRPEYAHYFRKTP